MITEHTEKTRVMSLQEKRNVIQSIKPRKTKRFLPVSQILGAIHWTLILTVFNLFLTAWILIVI